MPKQRSIFAYAPPFRFIADRLLQEAEFRSAVEKIVSLPEDEFSSLSEALSTYPNFLGASDVAAIVQKKISSTEPEPLARAMLRLSSSIRSAQEAEEEALEGLCSAVSKDSVNFPPDKIDVLRVRLRKLVLAPRGFKRQKKAETLAEATGAELSEVNILCDMRPVFDDARREIEGALIVATLTLEILELDGRLASVECRLSEQQLDDLCRISLYAKQKIVAIKNLLTAKEIPEATVFETAPTEKK